MEEALLYQADSLVRMRNLYCLYNTHSEVCTLSVVMILGDRLLHLHLKRCDFQSTIFPMDVWLPYFLRTDFFDRL